MDNLPPDLTTNILRRLPVKSLIRCTVLSKSYMKFITSRAFNSAHLSNSSISHLLLRYSTFSDKELYHFERDDDEFSGFQFHGSLFPFASHDSSWFTVVGCVNGVICLVDDSHGEGTSIFLWNPSVRRYVDVPQPHYIRKSYGPYESACGFGYDSVSDDYKVVRVVDLGPNFQDTVFEVYSLKSGCWRPVGASPSYFIRMRRDYYFPCFFRGSVHWACSKWVGYPEYENAVLKFDVSLETFEVFIMPKMLTDSDGKSSLITNFYVQECRGMLGVVCHNYKNNVETCTIWVMKEYGVVNSWSKMFDFSNANLRPWGMPRAIAFRKSGELIMVKRNPDDFWLQPVDNVYVHQKDNAVVVSIDPSTHGATVLRGIYAQDFSFYLATYVESMELFHSGKSIEDLMIEVLELPARKN